MDGALRAEEYNERYPVYGPGRDELSYVLGTLLARKAVELLEMQDDIHQSTRQSVDLSRRVHKLSNELRIAEQIANTDALTDVANLRGLYRWGEQVYDEKMFINDGVYTFAIMTIDISHFKDVNEVLGHDVGDSLLRRFGLVLKSSLRTSQEQLDHDERRESLLIDHVIGRLGGDEFAVCLDLNHSEPAVIEPIVERIALRITDSFLEATTEERVKILAQMSDDRVRGLLQLHYQVTFNQPNELFVDFLERAKSAINDSKAKLKSLES